MTSGAPRQKAGSRLAVTLVSPEAQGVFQPTGQRAVLFVEDNPVVHRLSFEDFEDTKPASPEGARMAAEPRVPESWRRILEAYSRSSEAEDERVRQIAPLGWYFSEEEARGLAGMIPFFWKYSENELTLAAIDFL